MKFAIIVSRFNESVAQGLRKGAEKVLAEKSVPVNTQDIFEAPGAFEMPLIAKRLAKTGKYSGIVCLGCVIKGDTAHFEFISLGATVGIMTASLETEVPITFGILTTYTDEQAELRSQDNVENKGREAALACYESATLLGRISTLS